MEVLVEHDYIAKEPNELTITKGDIIKEVIKKQDGWWEGTLNYKRGLFPDNFVKVIEKDTSVILRNRKDASRIRQCRVVFSYKQDHEDELNLNVGDIIDILGEEEEGWWRGFLRGKEGVFPSNFVEEIVPDLSKHNTSKENLSNTSHEPAPPLFAKPPKILCEVKYPYKAQNEDELTLKEGDIVTLVSKDGQDAGWWKGELNGIVGVFPDNFVTVLPIASPEENPTKEEKKPKAFIEPTPIKSSAINAQRKLQEPNEKLEIDNNITTKTTPPLPAKKPNIPLKKSPSGSGTSSGGIFYGLKKKIVDVVDGATGSKISPSKTETNENISIENIFDDVHRRPLLSDVRASRPKAPGRRPPSMVGRDQESGLVNGNSDHSIDPLPENSFNLNDDPNEAAKPKIREWAKHHPAPWLEEMKLNQAKRSSSVSTSQERLKLTPTDKSDSDEKSKPIKKETSPIDRSKSITNLSTRIKTPTNEFPITRVKPNVPIPSRPQTIQNVSNLTDIYSQKNATPIKVSPISHKTPSPIQKVETENVEVDENFSNDKIIYLEQRIAKLEELFEKQLQSHEAAIEEIRGKLQIETEMRMKLQAKFEKLSIDGAIQQL